jgi:hypothetical protein
VITVAVEREAEDVREFIESAAPTHPSLIDTDHVLAELYNMVNVPTVLWIDEQGRIVRPNDVAFTTERGGRFANVSTDDQMALLRRWVHGDLEVKSAAEIRSQLSLPSDDDQLARAHFGLGNWLWREGEHEAAARHFARGGELAPHDFMIRRGTMRMVGQDPFGQDFRAMIEAWRAEGNEYYHPLPVE